MRNNISKLAESLRPTRLTALAQYLLKDEAISGKLILAATVLALIAANTGLQHVYDNLWHADLSVRIGDWTLSKDLRGWVDEGLMALFFLVVGLELKRELVTGELRRFKTAALPFAAAIGGMIVPAVLYTSLNMGTAGAGGWAIPMATDIAFAVAILALVGKGIPSSVRLFLLTLAIVDDIGAVIVIALFYNHGLHPAFLLYAGFIAVMFAVMQRLRILSMPVFVIGSVMIWLLIDQSGVHASIAGVIIGLLAPLSARRKDVGSIAERLEHATIPVSTLIVVPVFAFANTGIILSLKSFNQEGAGTIAVGIILGLVVGKVVGIVGASWLMVRCNLANMPTRANWTHIVGVGLLAGIGFTVSIFVTDLAFTDENLINVSKMSIFIASALSGILGMLTLRAVRSVGR